MKNNDKKNPNNRTFSLAAALGDQAKGIIKGASAVPLVLQLNAQIKQFIRAKIFQSQAPIIHVLEQKITSNGPLVLTHKDLPLKALEIIISKIINNNNSLFEFVRQVDQIYGKMYQERPHFQMPGQSPHKDDEYTHESVKKVLANLLLAINEELA